MKAEAAAIGTAVRELEMPIRRKAEFHFSFKVASSGLSRNGGIAFGPESSPDQLVRCMIFLRGQRMEIQGKNLVAPVKVEVADLKPENPLTGSVIVDLEHNRVTFKIGTHSAEALLSPAVREIRWHGYAVEHATTSFAPLELKSSE